MACSPVRLHGHAANASGPAVRRLTSTEWPPYSGEALPGNGASTAVVRAALAAVGFRLEVAFFRWRRAVAVAGSVAGYVGYFPEYLSEEIMRECLLSKPIWTGPLGFAKRANAPVYWRSLDDLSQYTIGIIDGCIHANALNQRVRDRKQPADVAHNDAQNLVKLAAGRFDLAVIDRRVFKCLTRHDPYIRTLAPQLRFNNRLLEEKQLFVCFRRDADGDRARRVLNEGLKRIDVQAVMAVALRRIHALPLPLARPPSTMKSGTED